MTLEEKIVISKTLALSTIMFQLLINIIPSHIISELISIQKTKKIIWTKSNPKIRRETLCKEYKDGVTKNVHIPRKNIYVCNAHG